MSRFIVGGNMDQPVVYAYTKNWAAMTGVRYSPWPFSFNQDIYKQSLAILNKSNDYLETWNSNKEYDRLKANSMSVNLLFQRVLSEMVAEHKILLDGLHDPNYKEETKYIKEALFEMEGWIDDTRLKQEKYNEAAVNKVFSVKSKSFKIAPEFLDGYKNSIYSEIASDWFIGKVSPTDIRSMYEESFKLKESLEKYHESGKCYYNGKKTKPEILMDRVLKLQDDMKRSAYLITSDIKKAQTRLDILKERNQMIGAKTGITGPDWEGFNKESSDFQSSLHASLKRIDSISRNLQASVKSATDLIPQEWDPNRELKKKNDITISNAYRLSTEGKIDYILAAVDRFKESRERFFRSMNKIQDIAFAPNNYSSAEKENAEAIMRKFARNARHLANVQKFILPMVKDEVLLAKLMSDKEQQENNNFTNSRTSYQSRFNKLDRLQNELNEVMQHIEDPFKIYKDGATYSAKIKQDAQSIILDVHSEIGVETKENASVNKKETKAIKDTKITETKGHTQDFMIKIGALTGKAYLIESREHQCEHGKTITKEIMPNQKEIPDRNDFKGWRIERSYMNKVVEESKTINRETPKKESSSHKYYAATHAVQFLISRLTEGHQKDVLQLSGSLCRCDTATTLKRRGLCSLSYGLSLLSAEANILDTVKASTKIGSMGFSSMAIPTASLVMISNFDDLCAGTTTVANIIGNQIKTIDDIALGKASLNALNVSLAGTGATYNGPTSFLKRLGSDPDQEPLVHSQSFPNISSEEAFNVDSTIRGPEDMTIKDYNTAGTNTKTLLSGIQDFSTAITTSYSDALELLSQESINHASSLIEQYSFNMMDRGQSIAEQIQNLPDHPDLQYNYDGIENLTYPVNYEENPFVGNIQTAVYEQNNDGPVL